MGDIDIRKLEDIAKGVRKDIITQIYKAGSGHPGGSLSCVEILVSLYFGLMDKDDMFFLSKGHAVPALYSVLSRKGVIPKQELDYLRKVDHVLQGHPAPTIEGIISPSGSLGTGFSIATGYALAKKRRKEDGFVYVVAGDGETQEGLVWEIAGIASQEKLDNLIAFVDYNGLQLDGVLEAGKYDITSKFESFGWYVEGKDTPIDKRTEEFFYNGHNFEWLYNWINHLKSIKEMPKVIIANTIKGKGVSFMENNYKWHGKAPNEDEYKKAINEIENG